MKKPSCTIIVPIGTNNSNLAEIKTWLPFIDTSKVCIHLVHDIKDPNLSVSIRNYLEELNDGAIYLTEGYFGSPGLARNVGLNTLNTEWFCFWDSDDFIRVATFHSALQSLNSDFDVLIGDYEIQEGESSRKKEIMPSKQILSQIVLDPGLWRMIFNKRYFGNSRFRDFIMGEDQIYLIESKFDCARMRHTDKSWYTYVKGSPFQLTSSQKNLEKLSQTIVFTANLALSLDKSESDFANKILAKQFITKMNVGNFLSNLRIIKFLFHSLRKASPLQVLKLISSLLSVSSQLVARRIYEK